MRAFVAPGQKNDYLAAPLLEIHPVTGTVINSQLGNTFANRLNIPRVSPGKPFEPCLDARPRSKITQAIQLSGEELGFAKFLRRNTVAEWLHIVNTISAGFKSNT